MAKKKSTDRDRLGAYRRKRVADSTPEPFGAVRTSMSRLFVVQQHAARRMHFDLRLEWGGVLHSWAVPRGPSFDPQVKRLAVAVEEHPIEYADFEGTIPEGNYGAGAVVVWDRGRWVSHGDPEEGVEKGKLLFDLWGHKLKGRWTLFRTKGAEQEWLLVKKPDGYASPEADPPAQSILSGLTVEQVAQGADPAKEIRRQLGRRKAAKGEIPPGPVPPMLARTADEPFSRKGWIFELKYDGYRLIARRDAGAARLFYRRGQDTTARYPELELAVSRLPFDSLVLDGELVVADPEGKPSFQRLQRRATLRRRAEIESASVQLPATMYVFDLLACEGHDLRTLPLSERKSILRKVLPPVGPLRYSEHIERRGEEMYEQVVAMGLEGIVAKQADSTYESTRSPAWLKIRADRTGDFVVVGFSPPDGARAGFGALHLATPEDAGWLYAGRVGSGFDGKTLEEVRKRLEPLVCETAACSGALPRGQTWVEPRLVVEVRFKEWTAAGHLRHPVFLRLRDDKATEDCTARSRDAAASEPEPPDASAAVEPDERVVSMTNLDKIFWPEEGYTKGDLIEYYRSVSAWLLPYLKDRPLVLTRYPDGIAGKNFYQKDAPGYVPEWIRTETMWSEHAQRKIHYFICDDEPTLTYLINLGTIPLHLWSSRIGALQHPDWCILDLDPKEAPFRDVVRVARETRRLCEEIGLESFVKTSGSSGLHVLLPLAGLVTYEQSRQLAELLARVVASRVPEIATLARPIAARDGRVYIDFLQNGHGRLLVAPFSVRPLPGAPVSTPLRWSEVNARLDIGKHTIRTVPARLRKQKREPLIPLLQAVPDLHAVLEALALRLDAPA